MNKWLQIDTQLPTSIMKIMTIQMRNGPTSNKLRKTADENPNKYKSISIKEETVLL